MKKQFNMTLEPVPRDFRVMIDEAVQAYGEREAYIVKTKRESGTEKAEYRHVTFSDFKQETRILGTALLDLFPQGTHIGVMGENRYEWCLTYLSIVTSGDVVVPVDKELNKDEIHHVLSESGAKCIIVSDKIYAKALKEALPTLPELELCVLMDKGDEPEQPECGTKVIRFESLLERGKALLEGGDKKYDDVVIDPEIMSVLIFTSGTTGVSKGVMLSQKNILTDMTSVMQCLDHCCEDSMLSILPIHHTYECTTTFLVSFRMGVRVAFCDGLRYIAKNIDEYRPTMMMLVPLIIENMYKKIEAKAKETKFKWFAFRFLLGLSGFLKHFGINAGRVFFKSAHKALGGRIKLLVAGAAAMKPEICKNLDRMGFKIRQGYGLTETSPILCVNRDSGNEYDSVGPAMPGIQIRIADPDEEGRGEIQAKGDNVMLGYYKNPEATKATFTEDGWFRTGDQGRMDELGRVYITGRIKNIIVTNTGKNIFPEELEDKIQDIPYVKECMVWGDNSGDDGQEDTKVCVTVFPDYDKVKEEAARSGEQEGEGNTIQDIAARYIWGEIKRVNKDLPAYKRICGLELRDTEFEKTSTNKIQRFKVKHDKSALRK